MSSMAQVVSETNTAAWREPFTSSGIRPAEDAAGMAFFHVHEVGCKLLKGEWEHRGVCSPFWRAYHNAGAGAAVRFEGRRLELRPAGAVLIPPGTVFDCTQKAPVRHTWVHFSLPPALTAAEAPVVVPLPAYARALAREVAARAGHGIGDARLTHAVLAWLHAMWNVADIGRQRAIPPRLRRAYAMMAGPAAAPPGVGALAAACGLSTGAFIRWFKAETGVTPTEFITRRRVTEASRLLRYSDLSVEQVAEKTGYANRYHFSRVFARVAGCGPAAFRRGSGA